MLSNQPNLHLLKLSLRALPIKVFKLFRSVACIVFMGHSICLLAKDFSATSVPVLNWPIEIVSEGHGFTEGPALSPDGAVYFTDLDNAQILRYDPRAKDTMVWASQSFHANGLLFEGNWLFACEASGRAVVRYDVRQGPHSRELLVDRYEGKRFGSPNDLAIIGDQLVFSSFYWKGILNADDQEREIDENRCYILDLTDRSVRSIDHVFETPIGVVYDSTHNRVFLGEMKNTRIYTAYLDENGFGPTELFFDLATIGKGKPDGMTVSKAGYLFVALYGQSDQLLILTPDAVPVGVLNTGPKTSNCTLSADEETLYITADHKLKRVSLALPRL